MRLRGESSHTQSHTWCHLSETSETHKFLVTKCRPVVARTWPRGWGRCGDSKLKSASPWRDEDVLELHRGAEYAPLQMGQANYFRQTLNVCELHLHKLGRCEWKPLRETGDAGPHLPQVGPSGGGGGPARSRLCRQQQLAQHRLGWRPGRCGPDVDLAVLHRPQSDDQEELERFYGEC